MHGVDGCAQANRHGECMAKRRPAKRMPEPIPDTPGNVAKALMSIPPKKPGEWRYDKDRSDDRD